MYLLISLIFLIFHKKFKEKLDPRKYNGVLTWLNSLLSKVMAVSTGVSFYSYV